MTLAEALDGADYRAQLVTLRDFLAERLECSPPREWAPIAAQLRAVLADLETLPDGEESYLDDLSARRESRRANAGVVSGA